MYISLYMTIEGIQWNGKPHLLVFIAKFENLILSDSDNYLWNRWRFRLYVSAFNMFTCIMPFLDRVWCIHVLSWLGKTNSCPCFLFENISWPHWQTNISALGFYRSLHEHKSEKISLLNGDLKKKYILAAIQTHTPFTNIKS